jgi:hypothetical protein
MILPPNIKYAQYKAQGKHLDFLVSNVRIEALAKAGPGHRSYLSTDKDSHGFKISLCLSGIVIE